MAGATKLLTAGGGGVSLTPASSIASDVTVNVPSQDCTLGIQGPAFSASGTAFQSLATGVFTKIAYNTKEFDTASCYDATTNYRFTPNVAGYYQVSATMASSPSSTGVINVTLYKNGSAFKAGGYFGNSSAGGPNTTVSALIYFNGTSDYVEIYGYQSSGGNLNVGAPNSQFAFSASMVRAA